MCNTYSTYMESVFYCHTLKPFKVRHPSCHTRKANDKMENLCMWCALQNIRPKPNFLKQITYILYCWHTCMNIDSIYRQHKMAEKHRFANVISHRQTKSYVCVCTSFLLTAWLTFTDRFVHNCVWCTSGGTISEIQHRNLKSLFIRRM